MLFDDDLPLVATNEELAEVKAAHPSWDSYYIASACIQERRDLFEGLWAKFQPYADVDFLRQYKRQFHDRTWEMYLGVSLLERGFSIERPRPGQPDIPIVAPSRVWVEAVVSKPGEGAAELVPDRLGEVVVHPYPIEELLLRICTSLKEKRDQAGTRVERGRVSGSDPYVIALNTGSLGFLDPDPPLAVSALFALGPLGISLDDRVPFYTRRTSVTNRNGVSVPLGMFLETGYSNISAVLCSSHDVLNRSDQAGSDFVVIHNPNANVPIGDDVFGFAEQYHVADGALVRIAAGEGV